MDFFEAVERRSSVRDFVAADVPQEHIERILDAGRRAPSGMNAQPVRFLVVRNPETIRHLARVQSCIGQVSLVIGVVSDPSASDYWLEDAAATTENMLLAITALGYASVWIQGTLRRHEKAVKALLGIPAALELLILLPVGRARTPVPQRARKPLNETVHWERW